MNCWMHSFLISKKTGISDWQAFISWVLHNNKVDTILDIKPKQVDEAIALFQKEAVKRQKAKEKRGAYNSMQVFDDSIDYVDIV
jgi:hypothetical protein